MPMQTLEQFERRYRLFEQIVGKNIDRRVRRIEQHFEEKVERPFRLIEERISRKIESRLRRFEETNRIRLNDEVRFIRSWIEKPLAMGAVTPSSKQLARTMARYVDADGTGPVIELGPCTGPVTEALLEHGVDEQRLVLLEFDDLDAGPTLFLRLLRRLESDRDHRAIGEKADIAPLLYGLCLAERDRVIFFRGLLAE